MEESAPSPLPNGTEVSEDPSYESPDIGHDSSGFAHLFETDNVSVEVREVASMKTSCITLTFLSTDMEREYCEEVYGSGFGKRWTGSIVIGSLGFFLIMVVDLLDDDSRLWTAFTFPSTFLVLLLSLAPPAFRLLSQRLVFRSRLPPSKSFYSSSHIFLSEIISMFVLNLLSALMMARFGLFVGSSQSTTTSLEIVFVWLVRPRFKLLLPAFVVNAILYASIPLALRVSHYGEEIRSSDTFVATIELEAYALMAYLISAGLILVSRWVCEREERERFALSWRREKERERCRLEAAKARRLLHNILPEFFVERHRREVALKNSANFVLVRSGESEATVILLDLVSFTAFASQRSAAEVIRRLNYCYTGFDFLTTALHLEKAKTIGDAFVSYGLELESVSPKSRQHPLLNLNLSTRSVLLGVGMIRSLRALAELEEEGVLRFGESCEEDGVVDRLRCRVGVYSGPVYFAVLGTVSTSLSFEIIGEAWSSVKELESTCPVSQVQVSSKVASDSSTIIQYEELEHVDEDEEEDVPRITVMESEHCSIILQEANAGLEGLLGSMELRVRSRTARKRNEEVSDNESISSLDSFGYLSDQGRRDDAGVELAIRKDPSSMKEIPVTPRRQRSSRRRFEASRSMKKRNSCGPKQWRCLICHPSTLRVFLNSQRLWERFTSSGFYVVSTVFHFMGFIVAGMFCLYFLTTDGLDAFRTRLLLFPVQAILGLHALLIIVDICCLIVFSFIEIRRRWFRETVEIWKEPLRRTIGVLFGFMNLLSLLMTCCLLVFMVIDYNVFTNESLFETTIVFLLLYICFVDTFPLIKYALCFFSWVIILVHEALVFDLVPFLSNVTGITICCVLMGLSSYYQDLVSIASYKAKLAILEQKQLLQEERDKCSRLVLSVLPERTYKQALNRKRTFESLECCVVFLELRGFPALFRSDAEDALTILSNVYYSFDSVLQDEPKAMKIKSIQETYLWIALPDEDVSIDHSNTYFDVPYIIDSLFSVFQANLRQASSPLQSSLTLQCGASCGTVAAGILGRRRFLYDIIGDCANASSRLCTTGREGKIHVMQEMVPVFVSHDSTFRVSPSMTTLLKGKGEVRTTFLVNGGKELVVEDLTN